MKLTKRLRASCPLLLRVADYVNRWTQYQALWDLQPDQVTNLQSRITEEDRILDRNINDMLIDWNKSKPVHGSSRPEECGCTALLIRPESQEDEG